MSKWYEKSGAEGDVVIGTRIRFVRNLSGFAFPGRMSKPDRRALAQRVMETAGSCAQAYGFQFLNMEEISKTQAVSLVERYLASPEFISEPDGRGMMLTEDESFSIMLNGENHLTIQAITEGLDLQQAYQMADQLDTILERSLHFAFDEALGYLTQNPVDLGTGMRASLILHLPAMQDGGGIARVSGSLSKLGLSLRGIYGSGTASKGAVYQLSNQVTLGLSEQEALANLQSIALQVIRQERAARAELGKRLDVQDTVSRSMGILQSAKLMTNEEFMGLISNVRFGVAQGFFEKISYSTINKLIIVAQPATLALYSGKKLTANERHLLRAQTVQNLLKADDLYGATDTEQ